MKRKKSQYFDLYCGNHFLACKRFYSESLALRGAEKHSILKGLNPSFASAILNTDKK